MESVSKELARKAIEYLNEHKQELADNYGYAESTIIEVDGLYCLCVGVGMARLLVKVFDTKPSDEQAASEVQAMLDAYHAQQCEMTLSYQTLQAHLDDFFDEVMYEDIIVEADYDGRRELRERARQATRLPDNKLHINRTFYNIRANSNQMRHVPKHLRRQ